MDRVFRVSVRELVAFSCFTPDIVPAADAEAMVKGSKAHRARQDGWQGETEKSLRHAFEYHGVQVEVFGRMDAFADGEIPLVEEIKLAYVPPEKVWPEHRLQAVCYAAMLAAERRSGAVRINVCYVNEEGAVLCSFEETLTADMLENEMNGMLDPYVRFAVREADHRQRRDASLQCLSFPFDAYRQGQRELAVQVYTAIARKKRLFASLPTGTGKSAAVLYPALKALGSGLTERVVYLTARNTARQSPLNALRRMQEQGMLARCCVLTAKEKLCPAPTRCHPDFCPRAKGHYLRQEDAIEELLASEWKIWDEEAVCRAAEAYSVCPFELALALCEISDVILMDINYAFDPFAQVKRLFQHKKNFTLLVDEAHHTLERVRESLSGTLDSRELSRLRTEHGKFYGRKHPVYRALGDVIQALRALAEPVEIETILKPTRRLVDEVIRAEGVIGTQEILRICLPFLYACEHLNEDYAVLLEPHGKERVLCQYCLLPGREIARVTRGLRGTVFFSATLSPLPAMKQLLGGDQEDACFSLPSPFPPDHLAVVRRRIATGYEQRVHTAAQVARSIEEVLENYSGNTIAYFPSYAYLEMVKAELHTDMTLWVQTRDMGEEDRAAFMEAFERQDHPVLGLCVLGGLFSEGIDFPGERLTSVVIVGVGLPVPTLQNNAVRACYQEHFGDGFAYACRIPGMQKVLQAAGRVIRSETDRGLVTLLDERYYQTEYEALLPSDWRLYDENIRAAAASVRRIK